MSPEVFQYRDTLRRIDDLERRADHYVAEIQRLHRIVDRLVGDNQELDPQ